MLTFDEAAHEYRLGGARLPSVTQLLQQLHSFAGVPAAVLAAAAERGTAVHKACELLDLDDLDESTVDSSLVGYVEAWKAFMRDKTPNWRHIELIAHHQTLRYAGMLDRFGEIDGDEWVVDIKTSATDHPVWGIQTAAYAHLLNKPNARRATVQLRPNGTYRFKPWTDPTDWPVFVSLVTLNSWKEKHA